MSEPTTSGLRTSIWWNPFTVERIRLRTSLTPEECIQRIRAHIYSRWRGTDQTLPFVGMTRRDRFFLFRNPIRIMYGITFRFNNGFRPIARGVVAPDAVDGTAVTIRLSLHVYYRIWWAFNVASFAGALVLSFLGAAGIVEIDPGFSQPLTVLLVAILAGGGFYLFYVIAFWFVRRDRVYLVETLQKILQA